MNVDHRQEPSGIFKVCVASTGLGHVARGIEAWAADLGNALARRGIDVALCKGGGVEKSSFERRLWCVQRGSASSQFIRRVVPPSIGWRLGLSSAYGLEQTSFAGSLLRYLRRTQADILHVQDPLLARRMQQARRAGLIRTRTILAHGTEEPPEFLKQIEFLQHLAPWHAESTRAAGVWRDSWTTIPNFVDTEVFRPGRADDLRRELGIPTEALVVLTVAAIKRHHKRIDYLVREFHELRTRNPDLPVWLVVAGGWEAETDELISEGQALLGDRLRFLVRYPREKIANLYRAADIFVLASLFEMMPIALIEAQASGLPCIVHEHPNLQWIVGRGALTIDMSQSGVLSASLAMLCRESRQRCDLADAARDHCVSQFSEQVVVDQILAYYDCITSPRTVAQNTMFPSSDMSHT